MVQNRQYYGPGAWRRIIQGHLKRDLDLPNTNTIVHVPGGWSYPACPRWAVALRRTEDHFLKKDSLLVAIHAIWHFHTQATTLSYQGL